MVQWVSIPAHEHTGLAKRHPCPRCRCNSRIFADYYSAVVLQPRAAPERRAAAKAEPLALAPPSLSRCHNGGPGGLDINAAGVGRGLQLTAVLYCVADRE